MQRAFSIISCVTLAMLISACDREPQSAETSAVTEAQWEWNKYQRSHILKLGTFQVSVQPRQSLEITSNYSGILTMHAQEQTSQVPKDYLWAEMDKEKLAQDKQRIEIAERRKKLEKHKIEKLERPEKLKKANEELAKAQSQLALMERIQNSQQLKKRTKELFNGNISEITEKTIREQKDAVELAMARLNTLTEIDEILWTDENVVAEMDLKETKRKYDEAKEAAIYKIPFKGELRIEIDMLPDKTEYQIGSRQLLATLNDYSEIHASLDVQNVSWINLMPNSLTLQLMDSQRTQMSYLKDRMERDNRTKKTNKHYIFSIPLQGNESLKRLAGTTMEASLSTQLSDSCYIVPKLDLSMYALGKSTSVDYTTIVQDLWKGAKVLAEGANHIAIYYNPPGSTHQ